MHRIIQPGWLGQWATLSGRAWVLTILPLEGVPGLGLWALSGLFTLVIHWLASSLLMDNCLQLSLIANNTYANILVPFSDWYMCLSRVESKKWNCWVTKSYANTSGVWHTLLLSPGMPLHMTHPCSSIRPNKCHHLVKGGVSSACFPVELCIHIVSLLYT